MVAHLCREYDPDCYRCELGRDEAASAQREAVVEYQRAVLELLDGLDDLVTMKLNLGEQSEPAEVAHAWAQVVTARDEVRELYDELQEDA